MIDVEDVLEVLEALATAERRLGEANDLIDEIIAHGEDSEGEPYRECLLCSATTHGEDGPLYHGDDCPMADWLASQAAPGAVGPEPVSGERAEGAKAILADAVSLYNRVTRGGNEGTDRLELTMGDGGKVIVMAPASRAKGRKEA